MERVPKDIDYHAIKAELKAIPGVTGVHDLHIWCLSIGKVSLSVHISSDEHFKYKMIYLMISNI